MHSSFFQCTAFYLWHGLAASTCRTYSTGQQSYLDFVALNPQLLTTPGVYLPASLESIAEWITHLADRSLKPNTIKSYLSSVRSLHTNASLPTNSTISPTIQHIFRGIKRIMGKSQKPKLPITLDILQKLAAVGGQQSDIENATFDAAIKLAWSGFLCCGKFTVANGTKFNPLIHLLHSCIQFIPSIDNPTHLRLSLPASKTDPGITILIARAPANSPTCPVKALWKVWLMRPDAEPQEPLFTDAMGAALSHTSFIKVLKQRIAAIGPDESLYSGHSFRRGAATSEASVGYTDYEIQLLGHWHSDAYKLYIDMPPDCTRLHPPFVVPSPYGPRPSPSSRSSRSSLGAPRGLNLAHRPPASFG